MAKVHVRNGDEVLVTTGSAKGTRGKVLRVILAKNQVVVEGAKQMTKATRARQGVEGGLVKQDAPIHISNVKVLAAVAKEAKEPAKKAAAAKKAPAAKKAAKAKKAE
jgi:large subunit ribosomal protein L24